MGKLATARLLAAGLLLGWDAVCCSTMLQKAT
jgi:hypothetical protein